MVVIIKMIISLDCFEPIQLTCITKVSISLYDVKSVFAAMDGRQGENPCHVLLVLLGLMSAPHCTHVRAALVSIKESS